MRKTRILHAGIILSGLILCAAITQLLLVSAADTVPVPTFSPTPGAYHQAVTVTVSDTASNAVLRCTLDGSEPSTSSPVCPTAIDIPASMTKTIKAFAQVPVYATDGTTIESYSSSSVVSATYTTYPAVTVAPPVFSPATGTHFTSQLNVTIATGTPGAYIHYTLDGTTPTQSSPTYTAALQLTSSKTIRAIAILADGGTYSEERSAQYVLDNVVYLPAPTFSPTSGTVLTAGQTVAIADTDTDALIRYTLDSTEPTTSSTAYSVPLILTGATTIKARAFPPASLSGLYPSPTATASYAVQPSASSGGSNSTTPTTTSTAVAPVFSPAAGTYTSAQSIKLSSTTPNAKIYYTLDGSVPTTASHLFSTASPIAIKESLTIKAFAVAEGYQASNVVSTAYTIKLPAVIAVAPPTFSPAAGTYTSAQSVTLSAASGTKIRYTTDGTDPKSSSTATLYQSPIWVERSLTLKAYALTTDTALTQAAKSETASAAYAINIPKPIAAAPIFSPAAGTYTGTQSVTITSSTPNARIYYTLDGTEPTTAYSPYSAAISVRESLTIRALAIASDYGPSKASAAYIIKPAETRAATNTGTPATTAAAATTTPAAATATATQPGGAGSSSASSTTTVPAGSAAATSSEASVVTTSSGMAFQSASNATKDGYCSGSGDASCQTQLDTQTSAAQAQSETIWNNAKSSVGQGMTAGELATIINQGSSVAVATMPLTDKDARVIAVRAVAGITSDSENRITATAPIAIVIDTDGDGIPDDMEKRLGTDPSKADSDGDGYDDKKEILNGYDPLGPGHKAADLKGIDKAIIGGAALYQPKTSGVTDTGFAIGAVENADQGGYLFSGKAEPNQIVTLYVYSDIPVVTTVMADSSGNWQYGFAEPLTDGEHEVYVAVNDETGKITEKSNPLSFLISEAKAVSAYDSDALKASGTAMPTASSKTNSSMQGYVLWVAAAAIIIGLAAFLLFVLRKKKVHPQA